MKNAYKDSEQEKKQDLDLNSEFEQDIRQLEKAMCLMQYRERSMATEWISKLQSVKKTPHEERARNAILSHILRGIDNNVFAQEPFNKPPPAGDLASINAALHSFENTDGNAPNEQDNQRYLKELLNSAYDNGDFLNQLPVPRDGAFFVLHLRPNL